MKNLILVAVAMIGTLSSCDKNTPEYTMEGKWVYPNNSLNTMYIYENGIRYTYYCVGPDCDSLYNTFQAGDTNALPSQLNYTFVNDTLRVDLNFGNELVTLVTFECDGGKLFMDSEFSHLWRLSSDCE